MLWIDAPSVTTKVVKKEPLWNRPNIQLVGHPVGAQDAPSLSPFIDDPIASVENGAQPTPTTVRQPLYLFLEPFS